MSDPELMYKASIKQNTYDAEEDESSESEDD